MSLAAAPKELPVLCVGMTVALRTFGGEMSSTLTHYVITEDEHNPESGKLSKDSLWGATLMQAADLGMRKVALPLPEGRFEPGEIDEIY